MYSKNKKTADSAPLALEILWKEGYFEDYTQLNEVEEILSKRGNNFPKHSLRMAMARAKFLTPLKNGGVMKYVQKKPFKSGAMDTVIHSFDERKFHKSIVFASRKLFVSKHYSQAIFEVCKLLNKRVQELSGSELDGKKLMLDVFSVNNPKLKFNNVINQSEKDEQEGFMHIFAGVMHGIRNPKGHEIINLKDPYRALEYLGLLSLLFRKLDELK